MVLVSMAQVNTKLCLSIRSSSRGHKPNARLVGEGNNLRVDEKRLYPSHPEEPYGMTSREGVFAGGDVVHKPAYCSTLRCAKLKKPLMAWLNTWKSNVL